MKKIIEISCIIFFLISNSYGQEIEGNFKIVNIDSIEYYYTIYTIDTLNSERLILSLKIPEDTITICCKYEKIEIGKWYNLTLNEDVFICANKEKGVYIDLLYVDYYEGQKFIAGKYKLPYSAKQFYGILYCNDSLVEPPR